MVLVNCFSPKQFGLGYLLIVDPVMDDAFSTQAINIRYKGAVQGDASILPLAYIVTHKYLGKFYWRKSTRTTNV